MGLIGMKQSMFKDVMDIFGLPFAYAEALAGQSGLYSRTHPPNEENRFGKALISKPVLTFLILSGSICHQTPTRDFEFC